MGITSVLLESGPSLLKSIYCEGLIDEIYQYSSNQDIDGDDNMKNPIEIDSKWINNDQLNLDGDSLMVFKKSEEECLAE